MTLTVPYDRMLVQQDPTMVSIPVPRINADPRVEDMVYQIAKQLAIDLYYTSRDNPVRMYLYNLVSINGWNNANWTDFLIFASEYLTVNGGTPRANADIIEIYTSLVASSVKELQTVLDQSSLQAMESGRRNYESIKQMMSRYQQQNNTQFAGTNMNQNYQQRPMQNQWNQNPNQMRSQWPDNRADVQRQSYHSPGQRYQQPHGNAVSNRQMSSGPVSYHNRPNRAMSHQDNSFIGTDDKYTRKNPGSVAPLSRIDTHQFTEGFDKPSSEPILEPTPEYNSEHPPLLFSGWERSKVVNTNNKYTWEIKMKQTDHTIESSREDSKSDEKLMQELTNELRISEMNDAMKNMVADTSFEEALVSVKLNTAKQLTGTTTFLMNRIAVVSNMVSGDTFRYTGDKLLTDLFIENDDFSKVIRVLSELYADYEDDYTYTSLLWIDNYFTNYVNAYLSKYFTNAGYIDSFNEDYDDLIQTMLAHEAVQLSKDINNLISSLADGVDIGLIKDCIKTSDVSSLAISLFVEKYSLLSIKHSAKDLDLSDLLEGEVRKVLRPMNQDFYELLEICLRTKEHTDFPSIKSYFLTSDGYIFEVYRKPVSGDILVSLKE